MPKRSLASPIVSPRSSGYCSPASVYIRYGVVVASDMGPRVFWARRGQGLSTHPRYFFYLLFHHIMLRNAWKKTPLMHIAVDPALISAFRWMPLDSLRHHERTRPGAVKKLRAYLSPTSDGEPPPTIPAILACARTNTILDGHHRALALGDIGLALAPVILLHYEHPDILIEPGTIAKERVLQAALRGEYMQVKETAHLVRSLDGCLHAIATLAPNCSAWWPAGDELDEARSLALQQGQQPSRANAVVHHRVRENIGVSEAHVRAQHDVLDLRVAFQQTVHPHEPVVRDVVVDRDSRQLTHTPWQ